MNNDELKAALLSREPVIYTTRYGETEYKYVSKIIYSLDKPYEPTKKNKIVVSCELFDSCGNSVTIARPEDIRLRDEQMKEDVQENELSGVQAF